MILRKSPSENEVFGKNVSSSERETDESLLTSSPSHLLQKKHSPYSSHFFRVLSDQIQLLQYQLLSNVLPNVHIFPYVLSFHAKPALSSSALLPEAREPPEIQNSLHLQIQNILFSLRFLPHLHFRKFCKFITLICKYSPYLLPEEQQIHPVFRYCRFRKLLYVQDKEYLLLFHQVPA